MVTNFPQKNETNSCDEVLVGLYTLIRSSVQVQKARLTLVILYKHRG